MLAGTGFDGQRRAPLSPLPLGGARVRACPDASILVAWNDELAWVSLTDRGQD